MRIAFLLTSTAISATARTAMVIADALAGRGHDVRIVTTSEPVPWRSSDVDWVYVDSFGEIDEAGDELVIADRPLVGRDRIIPLITIVPGPVVEEEFYRPATPRESEPLRVLLSGASQTESHGLPDGYGAVAHARWFHQSLDLVRVSPWAPSREEPLDDVQEFHVGLTTAEMTRLMHSCDLLLAPHRSEERFSLPVAEAMASGIPVVATSTPSHLSFDAKQDYALFAPEENPIELGEKLIELLGDYELRERLRARGREVAEQWRVERVVAALEKQLFPR